MRHDAKHPIYTLNPKLEWVPVEVNLVRNGSTVGLGLEILFPAAAAMDEMYPIWETKLL